MKMMDSEARRVGFAWQRREPQEGFTMFLEDGACGWLGIPSHGAKKLHSTWEGMAVKRDRPRPTQR